MHKIFQLIMINNLDTDVPSVKCKLYAFTVNLNVFQNLSHFVRKPNCQMLNRLPVVGCAHLCSFDFRHSCEIVKYVLSGPELDGICKFL